MDKKSVPVNSRGKQRAGRLFVAHSRGRSGQERNPPLGATTNPRPFEAPLKTVSTMSIISCFSEIAQLLQREPDEKKSASRTLRYRDKLREGGWDGHLVVVTRRQIDHDVLVSIKEHDRTRIVHCGGAREGAGFS